VINLDSLTEMARETASGYINGARRLSEHFLSINHERNAFTVQDIYGSVPDVNAWRTPCWIRRGYVEELLTFT
jgi:hypothetical protein